MKGVLDAVAVAAHEDPRVRAVELVISRLLRVGVLASLGIILIGLAVIFVHHPGQALSREEYQRLTSKGADFPRTPGQVIDGLADFKGQAIVVLGLMLLLATPIMRVAVSIFAFLYQKDRVFAAVTAVVLGLLVLSFVLGRVEG